MSLLQEYGSCLLRFPTVTSPAPSPTTGAGPPVRFHQNNFTWSRPSSVSPIFLLIKTIGASLFNHNNSFSTHLPLPLYLSLNTAFVIRSKQNLRTTAHCEEKKLLCVLCGVIAISLTRKWLANYQRGDLFASHPRPLSRCEKKKNAHIFTGQT